MNNIHKYAFNELLRTALGQNDLFHCIRELASTIVTRVTPIGPPFDVEVYTEHFGITVLDAPYPTEGLLTTCEKLRNHLESFESIIRVKERWVLDDLRPDATIIVVRPLSDPVTASARQKRRFTIAHECAHWFLRSKVTERLGAIEFSQDSDEEMLCDMFAAELLIPTSYLTEQLAQAEFKPSEIMLLANQYDVSLRTMLVKLTGLSRHYAAFALFSRGCSAPEVCYTTPVRQRDVFFDAKITSEVDIAFRLDCERRSKHTLTIRGKQTRVHTEHVPLANGRRVLSFISTHPFQPRPLTAVAAVAG